MLGCWKLSLWIFNWKEELASFTSILYNVWQDLFNAACLNEDSSLIKFSLYCVYLKFFPCRFCHIGSSWTIPCWKSGRSKLVISWSKMIRLVLCSHTFDCQHKLWSTLQLIQTKNHLFRQKYNHNNKPTWKSTSNNKSWGC